MQLCETCQKAYGGCSWTEVDENGKVKFEPVPGWDAKPTLKIGGGATYTSYDVKSCPLYVQDRDTRKEKREKADKIDRKDVLELLLQGMTPPEIAEIMDCNENTIYAIRRALRREGEAV